MLSAHMDVQEKWMKKRMYTFYVFCAITFSLGCELSLMIPSMMFYMRDIIETKHVKLFYGAAISAYPLGSIVATYVFGSTVQTKRMRTRAMLFVLVLFQVLGNVIFCFYYSPIFPVLGRLLSGIGDFSNMVIVDAVGRCYEKRLVTKKLSWLVVCYSTGALISPIFNIVFHDVDFKIGGFRISYGNLPGVALTIMFLVDFLLVLLFVSDLSKESDIKRQIESGDKVSLLNEHSSDRLKEFVIGVDESSEKNNTMNTLDLMRKMVKDLDIVLLLCLSFIASYALFAFDSLLSLILSNYFNLGVSAASATFLMNIFVFLIFCALLGKISATFSDINIILSVFILLLTGLISILILSVTHHPNVLSYILFVIYATTSSLCWTIEEVLTRSLLSKIIPWRCQSSAEGIRRTISSLAFVISGVASSLLFQYLPYVISTLLLLVFILFVLFLRQRKSMSITMPRFL